MLELLIEQSVQILHAVGRDCLQQDNNYALLQATLALYKTVIATQEKMTEESLADELKLTEPPKKEEEIKESGQKNNKNKNSFMEALMTGELNWHNESKLVREMEAQDINE